VWSSAWPLPAACGLRTRAVFIMCATCYVPLSLCAVIGLINRLRLQPIRALQRPTVRGLSIKKANKSQSRHDKTRERDKRTPRRGEDIVGTDSAEAPRLILYI